MKKAKVNIKGFEIYKGYLDSNSQVELLAAIRGIAKAAPLFSPVTPSGKKMSVQMTSSGQYGWVSDRNGYRYSRCHPNGVQWPPISKVLLQPWKELISAEREPDTCLINYYGLATKMGMHQDKDEKDFTWPVLSISLGDSGLFRMGNENRGGSTQSIWLDSGDLVVMGGEARLKFHGIDRIRFQSSQLLKNAGRINLTMRVVK